MNLKVVDFLRSGGTLAQLDASHRISARRHREHPNLVMLKYSQIDSPMADPLVQECRGLILDESQNWRVVSFPYRKFFNLGEPNAAPIDWSTAQVYEKLDGSLMTLYWYAERWHVASSGLPDAAGGAHEGDITFADLFWRVWAELGYALPDDRSRCYMFELMTPHNRVIVSHSTSRLVLHGCRKLDDSLAEVDPAEASNGWQVVQTLPLGCAADCISAAGLLDPIRSEGYVVRDANFHRVKIKSPRYVELAHLKDSMSPRRILEVIRAGEAAEVLTYFPEFREEFEKIQTTFDALCECVTHDFASLAGIEDRKAFAAAALRARCSAALFALRDGKAKDARQFFAETTIQNVERSMLS